MHYTAAEIAQRFNLELDGDGETVIHGLCGLTDNADDCLSFVASAKVVRAAADSLIPAFITSKELAIPGKVNLFSEHPEYLIAQIAQLFAVEPMSMDKGIHPTAVLGEVKLGKDVIIGANAVIGNGVTLGDGTRVHANSVIMDGVVTGKECIIYPNVTIRESCLLGDRVIIQPGAVIGGDGYGFVFHEGRHHKIPQIGNVIIADDVEIGSNTTIDRGRFSSTRVGKGTKLDNLIMLGHNVQIGEHCLIVSQVGIAGSTKVGNFVVMGGQAGVNGHIEIGDKVTIMGQTMVSKGIKEPGIYAGQPVRPAKVWRRAVARFYKGLS